MKKLAFISSIFIGITPSYLLAGEGNPYFTASIGGSKIGDIDVTGVNSDIEFDSGSSFDIGIGYDFGKTRLEGTYQRHQSNGASWLGFAIDTDAFSDSFLGTLYYDFRDEKLWSPFIGASLGFSSVEVDNESESSFTYGIAYGLSYKTSDQVEVFFKGQTTIIPELTFATVNNSTVSILNGNYTNGTIGLRVRF